MTAETIPMFESLPQDNVVQLKPKKRFRNILWGQLNRLMNHFKIEAAILHKATGIPFPTLSDWINKGVDVQKVDTNLKSLANHFGVTVDFLVFGTPMTDRDLELDDLMEDWDYGPDDQ